MLIYKEEVYEIISCAMEVLNALGHGFHEKMLNYLNVTKQKVGLIINFRYAKLEWKRVVL